ncbi:MAG: hypothetical protein HS117_19090 [Verrucomicrobiaceae bacterium]|nr:hypothetical protein [Verrucomicrobiaceae bacterium]
MKCSPMLRFACLALVLTLLPSCGLSFRSAWKAAPSGSGVAGRWEGTWLSAASGHTGKLRAVISAPVPVLAASKKQPQAVSHQFFYHCTWRGILSAAFKTTHQVVRQENGTFTFKGDHVMPKWVGGTYHYEGTIQGDEFKACYESGLDRGTFTMKRVR